MRHGRPRLLFLACYFPPLNTAACVRTWNTAKYLAQRGWAVTVVTSDPQMWGNVERAAWVTTELDRRGIQRILTGHRWSCLQEEPLQQQAQGLGRLGRSLCRRTAHLLGIDPGAGWAPEVRRSCAHLQPGDVDVILATGSPFASFAAARSLGRRLGCPYVLDYRDPWTGNPHVARHRRPGIAWAEGRLVRECAAAVIVSESWGVVLDARFHLGARLHVISNGYDPEDLTSVDGHLFDHFAIVYAGGFYPPKRVITPVMAALQQLQRTLPRGAREWRFHYYGDADAHVSAAASQFGVADRVTLHGMVPRREALAAVRGAGAAVVITSVEDRSTLGDTGMVTAKLFEAVGLGTPTLLVAPPDSNAAAVLRATGLDNRFTGSDTAGMARFLAEALEGRIPRPQAPEAYSWPRLAARMDAVLRGTIAASTGDLRPGEPPVQVEDMLSDEVSIRRA